MSYKTILARTTITISLKEQIILWKQNIKPYTKEHYVPDANNSGIVT